MIGYDYILGAIENDVRYTKQQHEVLKRYLGALAQLEINDLLPETMLIDIMKSYYNDNPTEEVKKAAFSVINRTRKFNEELRRGIKSEFESDMKEHLTINEEVYKNDKRNYCLLRFNALERFCLDNEDIISSETISYLNTLLSQSKGKWTYKTITKLSDVDITIPGIIYIMSEDNFKKIKNHALLEDYSYAYIPEDNIYKFISTIKIDLPEFSFFKINNTTQSKYTIEPQVYNQLLYYPRLSDKQKAKIIFLKNIESENPNSVFNSGETKYYSFIYNIDDSKEFMTSLHFLLHSHKLIDTNVWQGKVKKNKAIRNDK